MKIRLLPEAERDLEIGADFYESQRPVLALISMTALPRTLNLCGFMLASMKPTVASIARFQNDFLFRYTIRCPTIASTFTLFSMQGKIHKP